MKRECKTCEYWDALPSGDTDTTVYGLCRVDPPHIDPEGYPAAKWPISRDNDWCREWELREGLSYEPDDAGEAERIDRENSELEEIWGSQSDPGQAGRTDNADQSK